MPLVVPAAHGVESRKEPDTMSRIVRALRWLDKRPRIPVCIFGVLLVLTIGVISVFTGPQLSSSFLYLIPMLLVTRVAGFRAGFLTAILAATIWLGADLNAGLSYGHPVTPFWNASMRLGTFLVAVSLVSATKILNSHLEDRVLERTSALESQIAENRELERTILDISDRERAAVGQDLHDGLCQELVSAAFSANMLREKLAADPLGLGADAARIADMIDDAITQARNLARGLYPVRLETEGLEMALHELSSTLSRRLDIVCTVQSTSALPLIPAASGIHLYRIAQEAVLNAAKHANAAAIAIHISADSGTFILQIEDNGIGIDQSKPNPEGMGLSIMEYRARMIGANFRIAPKPERGTLVECSLEMPSKPQKS
jgi:signal transduction histidine kinase